MTILFLAPSGSFVDADSSMGPNVYLAGGGINDRIPYLCNPVCVPFAEGVVKFAFPSISVALA